MLLFAPRGESDAPGKPHKHGMEEVALPHDFPGHILSQNTEIPFSPPSILTSVAVSSGRLHSYSTINRE